MQAIKLAACCAAAAAAGDAGAQSFRAEASREARQVRQEARVSRAVTTESFSLATAPAPAVQLIDVTIGGVRDTDQTGTTITATPYMLRFKLDALTNWQFRLSGDGYTRIAPAGSNAFDGLADIRFDAVRPITGEWTGRIGIALPTHGDVGSRTARHRVALAYADGRGPWSFSLRGQLLHVNGAAAGLSSYTQLALSQLGYSPVANHQLIVGLSRAHRGGSGSATDISGEYDFPMFAKLVGALSATRGITQGEQHTAVEFDVTYPF